VSAYLLIRARCRDGRGARFAFEDKGFPLYCGRRMKNAGFLLCYLVFVTSANVFLKVSAEAREPWLFVTMFAAGNLAGFVGVLAYTGLLRTLPLHLAFPLSRGIVVLGVQLVAALLFFHETFRLTEAAGAVLVTAGILLVGAGARVTTADGDPRKPAA
jgi:multidrug transporter EmrE-like cation transporter